MQPIKTESMLIRVHGIISLVMVLLSALAGLAVAMKFNWPGFLGDSAALTWGRLRYVHTQGIFFGWLGNAFIAFMYYAVPRLARTPVTSRKLGWALFVAWNFAMVIPGWGLMMAGYSQSLEWAEFPLAIDTVVLLCFLLLIVQFVLPFFRTKLSDLYVTGWYILGGITFTALAYPVGNVVPQWIPGARGATYSGLWIHDSIGLWVTPIAVGIAYFVIPLVTGKPIFSHFLSMIGFWLLFLVYPLNGTHHYIFSSIPMEAQMGAIVASVYLGMDVILVVANQLLSLRGSTGKVAANVPLRFTWVGIVLYLIVSLQGSMQALMPVNRLVHFSDWVIGHSHLAMLGFSSFAAIGGLLFVWQHTPGARYSRRAANWSFWLLSIGVLAMVTDLTIAGLVQGQLWESSAPWMASVEASRIYWGTRTISGIPVLLGFGCLCLSMMTGSKVPADANRESGQAFLTPHPEKVAPQTSDAGTIAGHADKPGSDAPGFAWLRHAYAVTGIAGIGFFALSFLVLAVWPNQELARTIAATKPDSVVALTPSELRGRAIYAREGCAYCHTQLIRSTQYDVRRFGPVSRAWETDDEFPHLWGTRRVGPDLARAGGKRPNDWQFTHLFEPRSVVPRSMMPPYPWLFNGSANAPNQEGIDLVAYLQSLGRNGELAGLGRTTPQSSSTRGLAIGEIQQAGNAHTGGFDETLISLDRGPAPILFAPRGEPIPASLANEGHRLFQAHCVGCHLDCGCGDAPAAASLLPKPRELTSVHLSPAKLSDVLWNGVPGTSMPAWNELPMEDLRALAAFTTQLSQPLHETEPPLEERDASRARELFAQNCALCHGEQGRGDGVSAAAVDPKPTDFSQQIPTLAYAQAALANGVPRYRDATLGQPIE
ncbi:MAG: cbb3-type cytochrome c oxidase subunit I [Novipirellula sp. JB048]